MIPRLPYLAPWYRVARGDDKVVLEYGQRILSFEGRAAGLLLPALLPLLDGTRPVDEIVCLLGEAARPAIEAALARLGEHGVLLDGPPAPSDLPVPVVGTVELAASLRPGRNLDEIATAVSARTVAVVGAAGAGLETTRLLRLSGLSVELAPTMTSGHDLVVCAPSPAELPLLREWNGQALETGQAWLQILPFDGRYAAVGPLYLPGDTCCYECFRLRRRANLAATDELPLLEQAPASYPEAAPLQALVAGLATLVALKWLLLADHYVPAAFHAVEVVPTPALTVHHVHRVPRCPLCSGLEGAAGPLPWHKDVPLARG